MIANAKFNEQVAVSTTASHTLCQQVFARDECCIAHIFIYRCAHSAGGGERGRHWQTVCCGPRNTEVRTGENTNTSLITLFRALVGALFEMHAQVRMIQLCWLRMPLQVKLDILEHTPDVVLGTGFHRTVLLNAALLPAAL